MSEKFAAQVTVSTPGSYASVVAGAIGASGADRFDGLRFDTETPGETRLVGSLPDQAALQGVLERLYALSLPILSVVRLHDDVTTEEEPNA